MSSSPKDAYVDADAPFSAEEQAAAAVVLASVADASVDEALARKLRADAKAYFEARRKPRAVTTTSGAAVVIVDEDASAAAQAPPARFRWAAWLAAAACVAIGVFAARAQSTTASPASYEAAFAGAHPQVRFEADGALALSDLTPLPSGCQYVLWAQGASRVPRKLAAFGSTSYRHTGGLGSTEILAVTMETLDARERVIVIAREHGTGP